LQGCDTLALGSLRYVATASPAYMARWLPEGVTAAGLAAAPALTFSDKDRLQEIWVARQLGSGAKRAGFPSHRLASSQGFVDACLAGLGWGLNPQALVAAHLAEGRLMDLSPEAPLDVALYWQFSRLTAPALAGLTREIRAAAARVLVGA
jgi:LysR family transcriptional regulator, chromosome initiation inhibitor